jgi:hypothetical protein
MKHSWSNSLNLRQLRSLHIFIQNASILYESIWNRTLLIYLRMKPSTEHFNLPLFKMLIDSYLNLTEQMYIFNSFINLQISGFLLRTILLFHVSNIVCVLWFPPSPLLYCFIIWNSKMISRIHKSIISVKRRLWMIVRVDSYIKIQSPHISCFFLILFGKTCLRLIYFQPPL